MVDPNTDIFGEEPQNQAPHFSGRDLFSTDPLLVAMATNFSDAARQSFKRLGTTLGSADSFHLAMLANKNPPTLKTHDERGKRIDRVEYHPSYHALMRRSVGEGLHASIWEENNARDAGNHHQTRAIRFYLTAGVESGHLSVLSMTNASPAALRYSPLLAQEWIPQIRSRSYDSAQKPFAHKTSAMIGLAMAEKQTGSDVNSYVTTAERVGGDLWQISGHKWFVSAPMADGFISLAKSEGGVSCFLVPRYAKSTTPNRLRLLRMKDKLGNRSNGSSEMELHRADAFLIGAEGQGSRTTQEMVSLMRLDGAVASAGMMRSALAQAVHHSRYRQSFEKPLIDNALMIRVQADLALDCAAATVLTLRVAEAFDRGSRNPAEALFARLMTPVVKYWVTKAAPLFISEALECVGGNGYTEDWPLARMYRDAPSHALWEGSGNMMCLEVLRVLRASPEILDVVTHLIESTFGPERGLLSQLVREAARVALHDEGSARILVEQLALTVAATQLQRIARADIADAFLDSRLSRPFRSTYGMIDARFDARALVEAMYPAD